MKWEDYRKIFMNYQQTVSETRLVSLITTQILKDFPNNIPRNLRAPAFRTLSRIAQAFTDLTKDKPDTAETKISIGDKNKKKARANQKITTDETAEKFALEILDVMISCVGREEKKFSFKDLNFQRLQSFQGLVMHFSNFEGILADSLRAICCVRPEVMKNKKLWNGKKYCRSNHGRNLWTCLLKSLLETLVGRVWKRELRRLEHALVSKLILLKMIEQC